MRDTFDMLLASANASVAAGGSLSPPSANTAISELRAAHIDFGPLNERDTRSPQHRESRNSTCNSGES